jgi:hypothetical protein
MERHWTLDDIPWSRFDPAKVDPDILCAMKAAVLVEHNSGDYVIYLCNVFANDPEFQAAARAWGEEEVQHGRALARWAALADPGFDLGRALQRFTANFRLPLTASASVRGSHAGELVARCVVEVGTSSFYSAVRDATAEPVLQAICQRIAGDEFRHFKLFLDHLRRYQKRAGLSRLGRLRVAFGRIDEASDDELASAYWAANDAGAPYDRQRHAAAYGWRAGRLYRFGHIRRGVSMVLKACDLDPQGRLGALAARAAWGMLCWRNRRFARLAA